MKTLYYILLLLAAHLYWCVSQSELSTVWLSSGHWEQLSMLYRRAVAAFNHNGVLNGQEFDQYDDYYGNHTQYIRESVKDTAMPHFGNEKNLFSELIQYNHSAVSQQCSSATGSNSSSSISRYSILLPQQHEESYRSLWKGPPLLTLSVALPLLYKLGEAEVFFVYKRTLYARGFIVIE